MAKVNLNVEGAFAGDKPKVNLNIEGAFLGDSIQKKNPNQSDTELSGVKTSTDTNQEEDGFFSNFAKDLKNADLARDFKNTVVNDFNAVKDFVTSAGKGAYAYMAKSGTELGREFAVNILPDMFFSKEKMTFDQKMDAYNKNIALPMEKVMPKFRQGASAEIYNEKDGLRLPDADALGQVVGEQLMQLGLNANTGGLILNHLANTESNYQEARANGLNNTEAYTMAHTIGLTETLMDKYLGVDKLVGKAMQKAGSTQIGKEAVLQLAKDALGQESFAAGVKTAEGGFKRLLKQAILPEAGDEFLQTYASEAEKLLFDTYKKAKYSDDDNSKLNIYDADLLSKKTFINALNSGFVGGLIGSMGGAIVGTDSYNPTVYATLLNSYDSNGKKGLAEAQVDVINGINKAVSKGKLSQEEAAKAQRNLELIGQNIATFDQKSDLDEYSRYQVYNFKNNVIPGAVNSMALDFAKTVASKESPSQDAINNDLENGNTTDYSVRGSIANAPSEFRQFIAKEAVEENGEMVFKGKIPNSLIQAEENNNAQIQSIAQEAAGALSSLTDNERVVSVDDIKRLGQQGSPIFKDSRNQLAFEYAFQQNEKAFQKQARGINLLKSIVKEIETTQAPLEPNAIQQRIENLYRFNTGDTIFVDNKSAKILDISNDGQKLKVSGFNEQLNASDPRIALADEPMPEVETEGQVEQAPAEEKPVIAQEETPIAEEEKITGRTMRDAVDELIPFTYRGETGEIYKQRNGVVVFESPNRVYEFGNIKDIGDKSIDEFDIIPQEMEIGDDFSVTIDGKTFTNKSQNPFKAITYDAEGNAVSIKLDNDKGQTRVIKGTRAMLIDAKYKIKQLFNDATRDQLAAAADDAARQAAATPETTGELGQATPTTENKPVEQAPSIAQQERAARIREVAKKLAEQENPQTTQNKQSIASLANSLFSSGIKVEVLSGDGIKSKYGKSTSQGMFLSQEGTIVINEDVLPSEWGKTVIFHEGTHPIINIIRNVEPKLYKQLVAAAKEEAKSNPEVNAILQQIKNSKAYGDEFTRNDELVVEMIARVASGKLNLNKVKPSLKQAFIDFINKIATTLGFNPVLSNTDQVAFSRLATQISNTLNAGRDIAEIVGAENVGKFSNNSESQFRAEDGSVITVGEAQFRLLNNIEDVDSGLEYTYIVDSDEFKSLVAEGSITDDKLLKDFNNGYIFLHQPDAAFTGEIRKNGVKLVEGNGGVFYPIRFHKDGYFWASTESAALLMEKALNENARLNNGRILMALTSAPADKILSSTTIASGAMDLFISKAFDKSFDVNKNGIKSAIIKAARHTETKNVSGKDKVIGLGDKNTSLPSLDINSLRDYVRQLLSPDKSSFADRKVFTMELANQVAKLAKSNPTFEQQLGQFLHVGIDNKVFKGKYSSGYKISKTNIIDGLSYLFSEPMLRKTPETLDEKGGNVYAIIEAVGTPGKDLVKAVDSKGHDSYPKAIQAVDDSVKIKLHILQDRQKWNQNFEDSSTNAIVTKERENSVFPPSTGVSTGSLKLNAQYSDINRETLVAPNGQPSNLNANQHKQVRTPEFKAWFGDWENDPENASKIVDENGEPMVVYTGTSKDKDFASFNVPANGAWFTSDPEVASMYAKENDSQKTKMDVVNGQYKFTDINTAPRVIPAFLNIKNPVDFKTTDLITDKQRESLRYADNYKKEQKILFQNIFYSKSLEQRQKGDYIDGITYAPGVYVVLKDPTQIKSAIGNNGKFSPTNPKIQMSDIDRTYTPESTAAAAGMTIKEREQWKEKNKVNQKQVRNPIVQKAASSLFDGDITLDDYVNTVRENQPIKPFTEVPKLPSVKDIIGALDNSKLEKAGVVGVNRSFNDGDKVATRLDIPAYENYDTWVVSIHGQRAEGKDGQILAYGQTAVLKNVQFKTSAKGGIGIAIEKEKNTIARMWGDWTNESPESVHKRATELMNDPQWVQVGMNPFRHSFFYDKSTGEAVTSAEEVIQVGALVLAKNPVKAPFGSQAFIDNFSFKNKIGETIQFSDMNRDDKRIQFVRDNINNYSKSELTEGLMQAFNMSQEAAERIVAQATADPLAPSIPQDNPDTSIPKGAKLNQKSQTTEEYNSGYDKAKRAILEKAEVTWEQIKRKIVLEYDSKFYGRRNLGKASTGESLAQARLRNINGIAYSAGQDLSIVYNDIFGNGLEAEGERTLNAMIFNLRILQVDRNTENKYADEIERLTLEFADINNRMPNAAESISISKQARVNVPVKKHGKTLDGSVDATSATAQAYLDALRLELGESEYNMLMARAEMYRKVGNEQVAKLQAAGIISKEVADSFKDDFYSYRKTLDRLYGEQDPTITMLNGVSTIKGWASLSKEGTENYLEQDARLLLAESYIGTARAIAKNKLRESIFEENIKVDENGNESSVIDVNGNRITFIKPAKYIRDNNGNIRSNNKQLSVRDADEGYVNVPYKKNGVVNYFQMEREMFDQIEGNNIKWNDAKQYSGITNAYYWTTDITNRILTGMATRKNPMFWMGNVPMDLQQQVFFTDIWTQGNVLQSNVYSAGARAFARTIKFTRPFGRNKEFVDKTLAEFIAAGGAMDRMSTMKEQRQRTIKIALNEGEENTVGKKVKKWMNSLLFGLNEKTEIAMRLAAYDQAKNNLVKKYKEENGSNPNESDMLKIQEIAASQARGYTDFAQRGVSLPNLNFAYLNSSIQGMGSALEYSVDNKAKIASKISQLVVGKFAGTVAIMAIMGDAYDDLDEYTKDIYSFLYAFDTKLKDANGKPIMVTADVKNNQSLIPVLGITRSFAEMTMRHLQGKEQEKITAQGSADRFFDLINAAAAIPVPNVTSLEGMRDWTGKLATKSTLLNAGMKAFLGYDAFRGKSVVSVADESLSPYMQGMNDKNVAYFYKAIAKSMADNSTSNQISPAKMQAVVETFITSPSTNILTAGLYMVLSSAANAIVPAESEAEMGAYSLSDGTKAMKAVSKRFASFTDSEKTEFRKNEELYKQSKEEAFKYNDFERNIDIKLKELYKADENNFFNNVDKFAKEKGYFDNDILMERIDRKAELMDKNQYNRSFINENIAHEVKILHFTPGAEGKARLLKYMFDKDATKAREVIDGMIDYGTSTKEAYDAEDLYLKSIK